VVVQLCVRHQRSAETAAETSHCLACGATRGIVDGQVVLIVVGTTAQLQPVLTAVAAETAMETAHA
jgi:hypothetical protein